MKKWSREEVTDKNSFVDQLVELIEQSSFENVYFAGLPVVSDLGIRATPHPRLALTFEGCHQMVIEDQGKMTTINPVRGEATFMPTGCWNLNTDIPARKVVTLMFLGDRLQFNFVDYSGEVTEELLLRIYSIDRPFNHFGTTIISSLTELGKQGNRQPQAGLLVKALLYSVLDELKGSQVKEPVGKARMTWQIIHSYICELFAAAITRDSIAREFHITPNYLSNLCKQQSGKSFNSLLAEIRINHARQLLACYDFPIAVVGSKCGYDDTSYFCAVFKRHTGTSPAKYRAKLIG